MDNSYNSSSSYGASDNEGGFAEISPNRTLMAGQFTPEPPEKPAVVQELQTLEQLFKHYNPKVSVDFRDVKGHIYSETLEFKKLDDFAPSGIMAQSAQLRKMAGQRAEAFHIVNQLRNNKELQAALSDPEAKKTLLDALRGMIASLKNNP